MPSPSASVREVNFLVDTFDPSAGGGEAALSDLVGWLGRRGWCPRTVCRQTAAPQDRICELGGSRHFSVVSDRIFLRQVRHWMASRGGPRVALRPFPGASHYMPPMGLLQSAMNAEAEAFESHWRRTLFPLGQALNLRRRRLLAMEASMIQSHPPPRIAVLSPSMERRFRIRYGSALDITVVQLGVDHSLFSRQPRPAPSTAPTFLFAGHSFALKGLGTVLRALSRPSLRKNTLLVAGNGSIWSYRRLARRLGLDKRVRFLGKVGRERMRELYRRADCLVHPTLYDHCSLSCLEALASGCPVVTTYRNGVMDWVQAGQGIEALGDPRDAETLANYLERFHDPDFYRRQSELAFELSRSFDLEQHGQAMAEWLSN